MKYANCAFRYFRQPSSSTRRTWIEIRTLQWRTFVRPSSSTRRTWIEIWLQITQLEKGAGRPPHGGRGLKSICDGHCMRNISRPPHGGRGLKYVVGCSQGRAHSSSSTRRTWIEISITTFETKIICGRPPHGGRGLKYPGERFLSSRHESSSTRRTWIEMQGGRYPAIFHLESSSTRRTWIEILMMVIFCLPPGVVLHTEDVD